MYYYEEQNKLINFLSQSIVAHVCFVLFIFTLQIPKPIEVPIEIEIVETPKGDIAKKKIKFSKEETLAEGSRPALQLAQKLPAKSVRVNSEPQVNRLEKVPSPDFKSAFSSIEDIRVEDLRNNNLNDADLDQTITESDKELKQQISRQLMNTKSKLASASDSALLAYKDIESDIQVSTEEKLKQIESLAAQRRKQEMAEAAARARQEMLAAGLAGRSGQGRGQGQLVSNKDQNNTNSSAFADSDGFTKGSTQSDANGLGSTGNNLGSGGSGRVRSLAEMRQLPGNRRPQYDVQERLGGLEGTVKFLGFVDKSGQVIKLNLTQTSGYRSLDLKSLQAVKNWKFYPGQEGWVEIPLEWNLKGTAEELPALLRRKPKNS
jgi:TonB family protein